MSHWTAGSPSRKSVPETSGSRAEAPSLKRDGWMSCWKNRQKKWSNLGAWSGLQKALCRKTGKENIVRYDSFHQTVEDCLHYITKKKGYLRTKKMELKVFHKEDLV